VVGARGDRADGGLPFCDTDFVGTDGEGGGKFAAAALAQRIARSGRAGVYRGAPAGRVHRRRAAAATRRALIDALHALGFEVAVETNGTQPAPRARLDLREPEGRRAPRAHARRRAEAGVPAGRGDARALRGLAFHDFFLQPMDGPDYCLRHPQWRLSLQLHKLAGIP
jgi:7-carboxy-7-deazaguanine synthase